MKGKTEEFCLIYNYNYCSSWEIVKWTISSLCYLKSKFFKRETGCHKEGGELSN